jgi:hypothetical protein
MEILEQSLQIYGVITSQIYSIKTAGSLDQNAITETKIATMSQLLAVLEQARKG